jgi:hypothetical protein
MQLKNGKTFPRDYLLEMLPQSPADEKARVSRYRLPGTTEEGRLTFDRMTGRLRSEVLEHDPAYRAITECISDYDLRVASDRIEFIALVTVSMTIDPWGYVRDIAMRVVDNLEKVNKMDELEEFNTRLVSCENAVKSLREITDDPDMAIQDAREAGTKAFREHVPAPPRLSPPPSAEDPA